jgi:hypothetical protein
MPATMSLISIHKQRYAAAAGGGLHALQFIAAGVLVQVRVRMHAWFLHMP